MNTTNPASTAGVKRDFSLPRNTFETMKAAMKAGDAEAFGDCFISEWKSRLAAVGVSFRNLMESVNAEKGKDWQLGDNCHNDIDWSGKEPRYLAMDYHSAYTVEKGDVSDVAMENIHFVKENGGWHIEHYVSLDEKNPPKSLSGPNYSTPENTFDTLRWAAKTGNVEAFKQCFNPEGEKYVQAWGGWKTMMHLTNFAKNWKIDGEGEDYAAGGGKKSYPTVILNHLGWDQPRVGFEKENGAWKIAWMTPIRTK